MIDSRDINDLNPIIKVLTQRLLELAAEKGLRVGVSNTLRDIEKQNALYAQGRTEGGYVVTNVKGGYSFHNWGLAVDIVPLDSNGNLSWPENSPIWSQLGEMAEGLGMEWGGRWTSPVDRPHYQISFGYTCTNFVKGTAVPQSIKTGCKDTRLVKMVQGLLGVEQDGSFGPVTENAAKAYNASGEITAETLRKLIYKQQGAPEANQGVVKEADARQAAVEQVTDEQAAVRQTDEQTDNMARYHQIQELPLWAKPTIQKLIEKGYLAGNGTDLDLSRDITRVLVINDRAGLY